METVRKINGELAIAGSVTSQELQQLVEEGLKSVLNLQLLEDDLLTELQQHIEQLGLRYLNLEIDSKRMNTEIAAIVLKQIDGLPKPILVYCNRAMLAAAMALMHIAMCQGETLLQAFKRAENLGLFESAENRSVRLGV